MKWFTAPSLEPEILIGVVLVLTWSTNIPPIQPRFHLLDLFAGQAAATKVWFLASGNLENLQPSCQPHSICGGGKISAEVWL